MLFSKVIVEYYLKKKIRLKTKVSWTTKTCVGRVAHINLKMEVLGLNLTFFMIHSFWYLIHSYLSWYILSGTLFIHIYHDTFFLVPYSFIFRFERMFWPFHISHFTFHRGSLAKITDWLHIQIISLKWTMMSQITPKHLLDNQILLKL